MEDEYSSDKTAEFICELDDHTDVRIDMNAMTADFGSSKVKIERVDLGMEQGKKCV